MSESLLTVKQVAIALACSKYTVYRLIDDGELDARDIGREKRSLRVPEESVTRFLATRAVVKESA